MYSTILDDNCPISNSKPSPDGEDCKIQTVVTWFVLPSHCFYPAIESPSNLPKADSCGILLMKMSFIKEENDHLGTTAHRL